MDDEERINIGWTLFNAISALHYLSDVVLTPKSKIAVECASKLIESITDADLYPDKEEEQEYEDKFVEGWRIYGFCE
jgi:hypothetical protein